MVRAAVVPWSWTYETTFGRWRMATERTPTVGAIVWAFVTLILVLGGFIVGMATNNPLGFLGFATALSISQAQRGGMLPA